MNGIVFKSVSKSYNGRPAVRDFSLTISRGERIVVLGHSGCGKTTVLRLLAGFITPDKGIIEIDGQVVAKDGKNLKEPEERQLGMVFQDLALWPHLTAKGNLEFGLKAQGVSASKRKQEIADVLRLMHIEKYANAKPSQLSGGQQQRVALARALILKPKALLMDVRYKKNWSWYVTRLIKNIQKSVRQFYDIRKLRFLLYASRLESQDITRIKQDDAGVIWLGKS